MGKKALFITLGVILLGIIIFFIINNSSLERTGEVIGKDLTGKTERIVKESCPYECCLEGDYIERTCPLDYECISNSCIPLDSDGDGLTNIDEKSIGTDPHSYDTDGDTLSDYQEYVNLGTNPLDKNTDNDRYDDATDPNPIETNSAEIKIDIVKNEGYWNEGLKSKLYPLLGCLIIYGAESSFGEVTGIIASACSYIVSGTSILNLIKEDISYRDIVIQVQNIGDDYTSYVSGTLNVYIQYEDTPKELFDVQSINMGKLDSGDSDTKEITYVFKIEDYTIKKLKNILDGKTGDKTYIFEIENLDYEKF